MSATALLPAPQRAATSRSRPARWLVAAVLTLAALAALPVFVAEPFAIPSPSMQPTLRPGDRVLVNKLAYRSREPRRGELAAFTGPDGRTVELKRIVGVAGDRVAIADGVLEVNGRPRREPYVDYDQVDSVYFGPVTVPAGTVFVLGDNRRNSTDSRDFGPVPRRELIGPVAFRLWPPRR